MHTAPHILILGHGESGKTTLAETITSVAGLSGIASSMFMASIVAPKLGYASAEAAWDDRRNRRMEWKQAIVDYRGDDPARIVRELYEQFDIYEGLRDREEFERSREEGLFDLIVYVDRGHWENGQWITTIPLDPTMDMTRDDADVVLENNGTAEEFTIKCDRFAGFLREMLIKGRLDT